MLINILFLTFVSLLIVDIITTVAILKKGGDEHNPIVRWLISKLGLYGGLLIRLPIQLAAAVVMYQYGIYQLLVLTILYAIVMVSNITHVLRIYT